MLGSKLIRFSKNGAPEQQNDTNYAVANTL